MEVAETTMALALAKERLDRAAALVEEHRLTLNINMSHCPQCQHNTYEHWQDHLENLEMQGIVNKLRKFSAKKRT